MFAMCTATDLSSIARDTATYLGSIYSWAATGLGSLIARVVARCNFFWFDWVDYWICYIYTLLSNT